ncbi:MAG: sigma-70 family RNA polymerase sigma factor [Myxococcota bacterium]
MTTADLWTRLSAELRGWLLRQLGDPNLADDLLQETFLRVHQHADALAQVEQIRPWLYRIARNVVIDHHRRRRPTEALPETLSVPPDFVEDAPAALIASWLPLLINALPEEYREALRLVELGGISQRQAAEILSLSPSGARTRVQRGRKLLKQRLLDCCEIVRDGSDFIDYQIRDDPCDCGQQSSTRSVATSARR